MIFKNIFYINALPGFVGDFEGFDIISSFVVARQPGLSVIQE